MKRSVEQVVIGALLVLVIFTLYSTGPERNLSGRNASPIFDSSSKCESRIDFEKIFPDKDKIWIQVGTWLNPLGAPNGVGIIGFEPEIKNVIEINKKNRKDLYMIPAALSNLSGVATFGSGINSGQSASLNVKTA